MIRSAHRTSCCRLNANAVNAKGIKAFILAAEAVQWLHMGDIGHPQLQSRSHKG